MNQLAEIVTRVGVRAHTLVVFANVADDDVTQSDLWVRATKIAGVTPVLDRDGSAAAAFHAQTSGHVVVFDRDGRNIFRGGITSARGHEGDNPGAARVIALLTNGTADRTESPIFGCSMNDE